MYIHIGIVKGKQGSKIFTSNESPCDQDFENGSRLVLGHLDFFIVLRIYPFCHLTAAVLEATNEIEAMT